MLDYFRPSADKRLLLAGRCNYCGRGVNASHLATEVIAGAMTGTARLDLFERIGPYKTSCGRTFGSQMLVLGMLSFSM